MTCKWEFRFGKIVVYSGFALKPIMVYSGFTWNKLCFIQGSVYTGCGLFRVYIRQFVVYNYSGFILKQLVDSKAH